MKGRVASLALLPAVLLVLSVIGGCSSSTGPDENETPDVAPESVLVPAGAFTMGDGGSYCGQDEREVTLTRDFRLFQHEVTNQEYVDALQWAYDSGYVTATETTVEDALDGSTVQLVDLADWSCEIAFLDGTFSVRDIGNGLNPDHPVKQVSWYGAARYCDWLSLEEGRPRAYEHDGDWECNGGDPYGAAGYRLPTDAEWEYAAQYDDERIYPWGDDPPDETLANYESATGWTTPVGSYPDAPAELGLSDMAGNIMEWCNDWHVCETGTAPATDPVGPADGVMRMLRGGAWNGSGNYLTCAIRRPQDPAVCNRDIGFRGARTAGS
jgi:formylglycine-generating enzyme required for sulfatase activity